MKDISCPGCPFSIGIHGGLREGAKIELEGTPFDGSVKNFALELFAGPNIALHINARYGMNGEHALVMNSMEEGQWKSEERHDSPFHVDQHFHLKMKIKDDAIKIKVSGEKYKFHHRIPPNCINSIGVKGDITIDRLAFDDVDVD